MYLFLCLCDDFACLFNVSLKQSHQGRYVSYKIVPTTLMPEEIYCTVNYSFRIKFYCLEMQNTSFSYHFSPRGQASAAGEIDPYKEKGFHPVESPVEEITLGKHMVKTLEIEKMAFHFRQAIQSFHCTPK